ncbi:hypothetical protein AAC387_Pa02g4430 [Persea americana]
MSQQAPKCQLQEWWKRVFMKERKADGFFNPTGSGRDRLSLPLVDPTVKREPCSNAGPLSLVCKFLWAPWRLASSLPELCFFLLFLLFLILLSCSSLFFETGERA